MSVQHRAAAAVLGSGLVVAATLAAAGPASADQHGYDAVVCHTDTAYIYQDPDTSSPRLDDLPRGAHFHVYHQGGTFDFGVRNYNRVSGHVLDSQLCRASAGSSTAAVTGHGAATAARPASATSAAAVADVPGDRRCVQWSKVYVRNYPAGQAWENLQHNETFSVYEYRDSGWARGYAWGDLMTDKSPYAPPYDNVWVQSAALGHHVNDGSSCPP
ncbi:MAG TPA: hypothetical protein VGD72_12680 [Mycobacteriales bacterium]|jgi:hypothetical protein